MAILQLYLPSRGMASKSLADAQARQKRDEGKHGGPKSGDPITQAKAALVDVDRAEADLNTALAEGYEIKASYPALQAVGLNLVLYKEDPNN